MRALLILLLVVPTLFASAQTEHRLRLLDGEEPVPLAHVVDTTNRTGTVSDVNGWVEMTVSHSTRIIKISMIGYETLYLSRKAFLASKEVQMRPQVSSIPMLDVVGVPKDPRKFLKETRRHYEEQPKTTDLAFKGAYRETIRDCTDVHHLKSVFHLRGYDNQEKSGLDDLFSFTGDFVIEGLEKATSDPDPGPVNGLRWVSQMAKVRNILSPGRRWDEVRIDSVKSDGPDLVYYLSAHNEKFGLILEAVVTDKYDIRLLREHGGLAATVAFDPAISNVYPVYSSYHVEYRNSQGLSKPYAADYEMWILGTEDEFPYPESQWMAGRKTHDEDSQSMWRQKPLDPNFNWSTYRFLDW